MRLALKESAPSLRGRTAKFTWPIKLGPGTIHVILGNHLVNHLANFLEKIRKCFL